MYPSDWNPGFNRCNHMRNQGMRFSQTRGNDCDYCSTCSRLYDYSGLNDYGHCNFDRNGGCQGCGSCGSCSSCGACGCDPCFGRSFTVSGTVFGASGEPANGITVVYTVNHKTFTTSTAENGRYTFTVPGGFNVLITVETGLGVGVTPTQHSICRICSDLGGYNFTLSPVTPNYATVSGNVSGLGNNTDVEVIYNVNGTGNSTPTDLYGNYSFTAPIGASVLINSMPQPGYSVTPNGYSLTVTGNVLHQDFVYMPILT